MDLLLDDDDGFVFTDGDFSLTSTLAQAKKQEILLALRLCIAEWPYDEGLGIDWPGLLNKKNNEAEIVAKIRSTILGIEDVVSCDIEATVAEGTATITFSAVLSDESIIEGKL